MKIPRWIKVTTKWILFLLIALVLLYVLGCTWFSWSTKREWAQVKKELEARGEKLSLVDFVPAPIPDEENFYATPLFQEVITLPDGSKEFPRFKNLD
ncbi:MAG: hypothetical protein ABI254_00185, partial [Chthoniobacterales bacterium]